MEKTTEAFYLDRRHREIIDRHAKDHFLDGNRSLALRQILDLYAKVFQGPEVVVVDESALGEEADFVDVGG